eukprot:TRINITY_DN7041_c0_g1_i6.p1 TRINITY_DN7041_c0_g1~~TRINITY_DN7041_c0_g1_i6.p1  ORF type:complete len:123 (-),score=14.95 TRINITY_DN7041_c0_g1_i6:240-608(-)
MREQAEHFGRALQRPRGQMDLKSGWKLTDKPKRKLKEAHAEVEPLFSPITASYPFDTAGVNERHRSTQEAREGKKRSSKTRFLLGRKTNIASGEYAHVDKGSEVVKLKVRTSKGKERSERYD